MINQQKVAYTVFNLLHSKIQFKEWKCYIGGANAADCVMQLENGKFGDQKYLDDWTARFKDVHVLQHLGGGIAPWNVQQYTFQKENDRIVGVKNKH